MSYPPQNRNRNFERFPKRKRIVIIGEGETEYDYFVHIKNLYKDTVIIDNYKPEKNSPSDILKQMEKKLNEYPLKYNDEAWLVFDYDERSKNEFKPLLKWKNKNKNKHFIAVSNRDFEYWKILHFNDGNGFQNNHKKYHNELAKCLGIKKDKLKVRNMHVLKKFTDKGIKQAIKRAKKRKENTELSDWPNKDFSNFNSDVFMLAEKIIDA